MGLIIVLKTRKGKIITANVENFGKKGNLLQRIIELFEEIILRNSVMTTAPPQGEILMPSMGTHNLTNA